MTRIGFVRRAILGRIGARWSAPLWALLAILAPTLMRAALDRWISGLPFLTFFPALLVATVVLGWRWGVVVLIGSSVAASYMFQPPFMTLALDAKQIVGTICFIVFGAFEIAVAEALRRSVIELEERTQREAELNLELQHRVNNNLTVIQGLARQTARHAETPEAFYAAFSERLLAISEANQILSRPGPEVALLPDLADVALKPFKAKGVIRLEGAACKLPTKVCVPLVLALHELGTNAVKYGALSVPTGCVTVRWSLEADRCHIVWTEEGGPAVAPPTRRGLGSRLLSAQGGLDAVSLTFPSTGVVCRVTVHGARAL